MATDQALVRDTLELAAWAAAGLGLGLLALALAAEVLHARRPGAHLGALADRLVPRGLHRAAIILITTTSALIASAGPRPVGAMTPVSTTVTSGPTASEPRGSDPHERGRLRRWLTDGAAPSTPAPAGDVHVRPSGPSTPTTSTTSTTTTSLPVPTLPPPRSASVLRPGAPAATAPDGVSSTPTVSRPAHEEPYTVMAGDCLWSIAARRLGPGAPNAAIDRRVAGRLRRQPAAIGDDPNLIHPGLVLDLSALDPTH